ncbi:hypothetical protein PGB90_005158 [Kerria lacca]
MTKGLSSVTNVTTFKSNILATIFLSITHNVWYVRNTDRQFFVFSLVKFDLNKTTKGLSSVTNVTTFKSNILATIFLSITHNVWYVRNTDRQFFVFSLVKFDLNKTTKGLSSVTNVTTFKSNILATIFLSITHNVWYVRNTDRQFFVFSLVKFDLNKTTKGLSSVTNVTTFKSNILATIFLSITHNVWYVRNTDRQFFVFSLVKFDLNKTTKGLSSVTNVTTFKSNILATIFLSITHNVWYVRNTDRQFFVFSLVKFDLNKTTKGLSSVTNVTTFKSNILATIFLSITHNVWYVRNTDRQFFVFSLVKFDLNKTTKGLSSVTNVTTFKSNILATIFLSITHNVWYVRNTDRQFFVFSLVKFDLNKTTKGLSSVTNVTTFKSNILATIFLSITHNVWYVRNTDRQFFVFSLVKFDLNKTTKGLSSVTNVTTFKSNILATIFLSITHNVWYVRNTDRQFFGFRSSKLEKRTRGLLLL